jgi:hypothetical protein
MSGPPVRWHARYCAEASPSLLDCQIALAALARLRNGSEPARRCSLSSPANAETPPFTAFYLAAIDAARLAAGKLEADLVAAGKTDPLEALILEGRAIRARLEGEAAE